MRRKRFGRWMPYRFEDGDRKLELDGGRKVYPDSMFFDGNDTYMAIGDDSELDWNTVPNIDSIILIGIRHKES